MASFRPFLDRHRLVIYLSLAALAVVAGSIIFITRMQAAGGEPAIGPDTAAFRYRFGGEIITQYLPGVTSITQYRHGDVVDEVVFNLKSGKDYVVNSNLLVDYTFSTRTTIQMRTVMNKTYYRYDPYLQGEKQQWHKEWVEQEYLKWAGRLPTEAEWMEAFNELTRGVEHYQMDRWIQYSPPAIRYFIIAQFESFAGRAPTETEAGQYFKRLAAGESYEEVAARIKSLPESR
jgi:hypothetical protein